MEQNKKKRYVIEYYIKDLDPREQRGIMGDLQEQDSPQDRVYVSDAKNDYKNVLATGKFRDRAHLDMVLGRKSAAFKKINFRMMKNRRYPLFKNPDNLPETMEWFDTLITYLPEETCNKLVGCLSFEEYKPPVYDGPVPEIEEENQPEKN